jgi:hypothetical protein
MKFAIFVAVFSASITSAFAETPNEITIRSITNKEGFNRVFYAVMQAVIDSNPTTQLFDPVTKDYNHSPISTGCDIGDNGDTYCRTSYELYDLVDKLVATVECHSSGEINRELKAGGLLKSINIKTGETRGGTSLILSEDGKLMYADFTGANKTEELRKHHF